MELKQIIPISGTRIRRTSWKNKNYRLKFRGDLFNDSNIIERNDSKSQFPYMPTWEDMTADDWEIVQ